MLYLKMKKKDLSNLPQQHNRCLLEFDNKSILKIFELQYLLIN